MRSRAHVIASRYKLGSVETPALIEESAGLFVSLGNPCKPNLLVNKGRRRNVRTLQGQLFPPPWSQTLAWSPFLPPLRKIAEILCLA